jgi:hypothetical protein
MRILLPAAVLGVAACLFTGGAARAVYNTDHCIGTPAGAAMTLPPPLDQWAELYCTDFGHVIAARDGWIWTLPVGRYAPVFVPSQTGTDFPKKLDNTSYFTRIEMVAVSRDEAEPALSVFDQLFPGDAPPRALYRLDVTSVSTGRHQIYFLDDGDGENGGRWGIWCYPDGCDPKSVFILIPPQKK